MRLSEWSSDVCSSDLQQEFEFHRADFGTLLLANRPALRDLVVVEKAFEPLAGPVEDVAECPEQIFEIGLEPGILQRGDQRVEHVGDRAAGHPRFGRSEERRVRNEWVGPCRSRWWAD